MPSAEELKAALAAAVAAAKAAEEDPSDEKKNVAKRARRGFLRVRLNLRLEEIRAAKTARSVTANAVLSKDRMQKNLLETFKSSAGDATYSKGEHFVTNSHSTMLRILETKGLSEEVLDELIIEAKKLSGKELNRTKFLKSLKVIGSVAKQDGRAFLSVMLHVKEHDDAFYKAFPFAKAVIGRGNVVVFECNVDVLPTNLGNIDKLFKKKDFHDHVTVKTIAPGTVKFTENPETLKGGAPSVLPEKMNGENLSFFIDDCGDHWLVVMCSKNAPCTVIVPKDTFMESLRNFGHKTAKNPPFNLTNEVGMLVFIKYLMNAKNLEEVLVLLQKNHTICELMRTHFVFNGEVDFEICVLFARELNTGAPVADLSAFETAGFNRPKVYKFSSWKELLLLWIEGWVPKNSNGMPCEKIKTFHYDLLKWLFRPVLYALADTKSGFPDHNNKSTAEFLAKVGVGDLDGLFSAWQQWQQERKALGQSNHAFQEKFVPLIEAAWKRDYVPVLRLLIQEVSEGVLTRELLDYVSMGRLWFFANKLLSNDDVAVPCSEAQAASMGGGGAAK